MPRTSCTAFSYPLLLHFWTRKEATPPAESLLQRRKRNGEEARERRSRLFNGLEVHPRPGHASGAHAEDEDSPELERRTTPRRPVGAPLAPDRLPFLDSRRNLDPEIGNV